MSGDVAAYKIDELEDCTVIIWLPWKYRDSEEPTAVNIHKVLEEGYDCVFDFTGSSNFIVNAIRINPVKNQFNYFVIPGHFNLTDDGIRVKYHN